jgi:hypothetical protein
MVPVSAGNFMMWKLGEFVFSLVLADKGSVPTTRFSRSMGEEFEPETWFSVIRKTSWD